MPLGVRGWVRAYDILWRACVVCSLNGVSWGGVSSVHACVYNVYDSIFGRV